MASAMVGLALNKPLYRFTFGLIAWIQSKFIRPSSKVGIAGQLEACLSHNTLGRLELIRARTLVIVGTKDRVINPDSSSLIASKIPRARLVKIEGGSHSFSLEMKNVFNQEVLNFLKNNPR